MKLLPYGPRAVLAEFESLDEVMVAAAAWREEHAGVVTDVVPAARTVLVVHDGTLDTDRLRAPAANRYEASRGPLVTIDVVYDGPDLQSVAARVGLTPDEVVRAHTAPEYTVAFCGFMPGFSYLVGLDARLVLPRQATPRTRVPAGSVAIAAEFTGIYPQVSPGGWHLLGTTTAKLWDDNRQPPALLPPGSRVRFLPR